MNLSFEQQKNALELQRRLRVRNDLLAWAEVAFPETQPALHHRVLIKSLEDVIEKRINRLIVMMPPGSAKSSYTSKLLPPAFLARRSKDCILACSYAYDLAEGFGRWCRNAISTHSLSLGYELSKDSKAAGQWETNKGGFYIASGVNTGIAGRRADLGLIDDPIASELEASSKLFRDRLWEWYWNDFVPRLKPEAARIIICNRRHEDDLVGRLLDPKRDPTEAGKWKVLSFPMEAETDDDLLGRKIGERLWPEWFTEAMVEEAKKNPRTWAGLYQQHPTPESGDFFSRLWIDGGEDKDGRVYRDCRYQLDDLPNDLSVYVVSDHTTSRARGANKSCFVPFGVDSQDNIWIFPRIFWEKVTPADAVEAMLDIVRMNKPRKWRAEKGHISEALLPLITKRMTETGIYFPIEQVVPHLSKRDRCSSIAGRMQQGKVRFPAFTEWWSDALYEMMSFTGSGDDKSDDFCDCLGHIGMMMDGTVKAQVADVPQPRPINFQPPRLTMEWIKKSAAAKAGRGQLVER
jgi:predicted phage terminase large subunit-like protein